MITIDERIADLKHKIAWCARLYGRRVEDGKMLPGDATRVMEQLLAELDVLVRAKRGGNNAQTR